MRKEIDWESEPTAQYYKADCSGWYESWWKEVDGAMWCKFVNHEHWQEKDWHQTRYKLETIPKLVHRTEKQKEFLPEVGIVVEFRTKTGHAVGSTWNPWEKGILLVATQFYRIVRHIGSMYSPEHECSHLASLIEFRPVKTKEDQEKEAIILEIVDIINTALGVSRKDITEEIYDAGYRKMENVE